MNFLNIGPWELVTVLIIAILVAGPKRMVEIARAAGRLSQELRELSSDFVSAIQQEMDVVEREARGISGAVEESLARGGSSSVDDAESRDE